MKNLSIFALVIAYLGAFSLPVIADDIVVFGATGRFGSQMVQEALDRGHTVYGVSRSPENFAYTEENFVAVDGNPTVLESVKEILQGKDAVLVALGDRETADPEKTAMNVTAMNLAEALGDQGVEGPLVIAFGGGNTAGDSLEQVLEMTADRLNEPNSDRLRMIILSQWATYDTYRSSNINWVFLAPPRNILGITGGEDVRTGKYRISTDGTIDSESDTTISNSDIAVAAVDLLENREYSQQRVIIAY
jgi:uncharacterized protein